VPLLGGENAVGVLTLYSSSTDVFDQDRGRMLQMIAPHVAGAIQAAARQFVAIKDSRAERASGSGGRELRLVSHR
jgi:GAF domain-containing protein